MSDADLAFGLNVIKAYAEIAGVDYSQVKESLKSRYGIEQIESWGKMARGVQWGALRERLTEGLSGVSVLEAPSRGDINLALMNAGATLPDTSKIVVDAIKETGGQIFSFSKYLMIFGVVLGVGYLAFQSGVLKNAFKK